MENGDRPAENKRCFGFSQRHIFLILLLLGVVLFFYYSNIKGMAPEWDPQQWMQRHSTKLFTPYGKQSTVSSNTSRSETEPTAAPPAGLTHEATTAKLPPNTNVSPKDKPTTQRQRSVSSRGPEKMLTTQATSRPAVPYVSPGPYLVEYPYEYHLTVNEPLKCEQERPFVVLVVQVAPRNRAQRDVIRSSWGGEKRVEGQEVRLFFLLGMQTGDDAQQVHRQLLQESQEHHDLIQSNFVDCYKNLTIKTMVMLEWLNSFCSNAPFAMKIDSDMFLNVPNLVNLLLKAPRTNYMTGLVAQNGQILRDPSSKWYVPEDILSDAFYPPYALGLGYILSLDLTKKLIEASRHVKALYIEDVYLGLCMKHLGIRPTDPPNWFLFHVFPVRYSRCDYSKLIATTTEKNMDIVQIWRDFKKPGRYC